LVHCHSFFNFIMLNEDGFCLMELFVKNCKFCLNSEVVNSLLGNQFVDLSQVVSFGDVS
jgi:hypothetical protein